ncbi:predicted protein [Naegleria gruberi]|uniref:non-specific serine/threonine protein kinase n=1 Tax=Naegleria gruberi TaxID=5762 RepID=D2VXF6_NAEGR|nr:uncharacterized protein NAEGRDRAFT_73730 [Naegleria gruberi]EFC38430.1 predicted protein [Naegleria gruberi]|eukprot:XP_002671174.1 predicted protein [Naegleria gruberi strain NEG-M]
MISIEPRQNYALSSKAFRYGYFYMSYEKLASSQAGFRVSKNVNNPTSLNLDYLPTGDGYNSNFDDSTAVVSSIIKLIQFSNPIDYYFVLFNPSLSETSNVTIHSKIVETYRPFSLSSMYFTYLQKGEIEKTSCPSTISPCIDITNSKFYISVNPSDISSAQYKNNYPVNLEIYVQYSASAVNSNGELILDATSPFTTISLKSSQDSASITVPVPQGVLQVTNAKDVKPYLWFKFFAFFMYRVKKAKIGNKKVTDPNANNHQTLQPIQQVDPIIQNRPVINIDSIPSYKSDNRSDNGAPIASYVPLSNTDSKTSTLTGLTNSFNSPMDSTPTPTQPQSEQGDLLNMRYKPIEKIGNGSFGICFLCQDTKRNNQLVAIKGINLESNDQEKIISELSKSATIQHQRIVEVYEFFVSKQMNAFCLVMKYYSGDLERCVLKYGKIMPEIVVIQLLKQLGEGFDYLHRVKQVVHRDVKPRNIFVNNFDELNNQISVVIGDLGESKELFVQENTMRGTVLYMAPEVFIGKYGFPADIFSLGVSLYHVMVGMKNLNVPIGQQMLASSEQEISSRMREEMLKLGYSDKLVDFVISMIRVNPNDRPTAEQVKAFTPLDLA